MLNSRSLIVCVSTLFHFIFLFFLFSFRFVSFRFILNIFSFVFVLQIRHNVTSIVSKRDNRCTFVHLEQCVPSAPRWGVRERQSASDSGIAFARRYTTTSFACTRCCDDCCLMFFCIVFSSSSPSASSSYSSFRVYFSTMQWRARWFHSELFAKKKNCATKARIVSTHSAERERRTENEKEKQFMRANATTHKHTDPHRLTPMRCRA